MTVRSRLMVMCALPALAFGAVACGSSVSKGDFKETLMKDAKLSEPVAQCVTDELFRKLDEKQLERVYTLERAKLTDVERQAVANAAVLCVSGGPKPPTTSTSG